MAEFRDDFYIMSLSGKVTFVADLSSISTTLSNSTVLLKVREFICLHTKIQDNFCVACG